MRISEGNLSNFPKEFILINHGYTIINNSKKYFTSPTIVLKTYSLNITQDLIKTLRKTKVEIKQFYIIEWTHESTPLKPLLIISKNFTPSELRNSA